MIASKTSEFASQIENGQTVGISFHYYTQKNNRFVTSLIKKLLERDDKIFLHDTIITVLHELIINAVKANSKRYYFSSNNLDIQNSSHYSAGMRSFKEFIIAEKENIEDALRRQNLKVELYFRRVDEGMKIFIRNNTPILPDEMIRINTRIEMARKYNDFSEVYADVSDDIEGEGLGLLLTMLFLRNSGIGERSLAIASDGKVTQSTLIIPSQLKPSQITNEIQKRITAEVNSLPSFPEHVHAVQGLCRQPDAQMRHIAEKIMIDPSLTASVLRLANSAGFITRKKTESLTDAIKIIGLRNLSSILSASSARSIMDERYSAFKEIWEHCNRTAFYAREIATLTGRARISDQVFLSAMLHDLGKIVLLSTGGSLGEWITEITEKREIRTSTIIEEISIGMSHAAIGELISRKWNLPDYVTEAIRCHHSPLLSNESYREIVFINYIANEMCIIEKNKYSYTHLESDVLQIFGIDDEVRFNALHATVRGRYQNNE
jgi:HD-like signal output (HDOD) protein